MKKIVDLNKAYRAQKSHSKKRGIEFLLSFNQWLYIWTRSGHLHERGRGSLQYCMARFGDKGPYERGNVEIITNNANGVAGSTGRSHSPEVKWKIGCGNRGKPSPLKGIPRTPEVRAKIGAGNKGKKMRPKTEAEKQHLSVILRGRPGHNKGRTFSHRHSLTHEQVVEAKRLRSEGLYWRAIVKRLRTSRHAVWRALKDPNYGRGPI